MVTITVEMLVRIRRISRVVLPDLKISATRAKYRVREKLREEPRDRPPRDV